MLIRNTDIADIFDALADIPVATARYHAFSSFGEDFARTLIVYGSARQTEAVGRPRRRAGDGDARAGSGNPNSPIRCPLQHCEAHVTP